MLRVRSAIPGNVAGDGEARQLGQVVDSQHRSGRVVRGVDQHQPGPRTEGSTQGVPVKNEGAGLAVPHHAHRHQPGDEVLVIAPYSDSYAAVVALAGARLVTVGLVRDGESGAFVLDRDALRAAFGPRTRLVLVNSPHNPTGTVLTVDDLTELARLAIAGDVVVVTDEVYEHLTFDGVAHVPIATLPGMAERT